jgi:hypothetical protein
MTHAPEDRIDAWLADKRSTAAPPGFAASVMEQLPPPRRPGVVRLLPAARAALLVLAIGGGLGRCAVIFLALLQS